MPAPILQRKATMTTGIDRDEQARLGRWATEQLDLPEGAGPEEARAAFLRQLPDADFVPPTNWCQAVGLLTGTRIPGAADAAGEADAEEEERLRSEVEEYAEQFWSLALGERRQRWQSLYGRCGFAPRLRARLEGLRPGLVVGSLPEGEDAEVLALAQEVRSFFVLRPADRAAARQALVQRMRIGWKEGQATAKLLQQNLPSIAALEPSLMKTLTSWSEERHNLNISLPEVLPPLLTQLLEQEKARQRRWIAISVVILVSLLSWAGFNDSKTPKNPSPADKPRWQLNPEIPPIDIDHLQGLPDQDKEKLKRLQEAIKDKPPTMDEIDRILKDLENKVPGKPDPRDPARDPRQERP
jgi:hypothetical protein